MVPNGRGSIALVQYTGEEAAVEIKDLLAKLVENEDDFENWEKAVLRAMNLEGGVTRNSSPSAIELVRNLFDCFLAKFPLFFGYWKKYADFEFSIGGTETAEMVYERGVSSISTSVDLWTNYCNFKMETSHDNDVLRALFNRGADFVGMDFQSHPFWDKYIEFEDRIGEPANVTRVYCRAFQQITYNFTKYFEKFRSLVSTRPIEELGDEETLESVQKAVDAETIDVGYELAPLELERAIRAKLDQHYLAIYAEVQKAVHERWTFENAIKRSYFHVTDVDESELENWHKYLKYEEEQGDLKRIMFLYERCLVACALYEQFWLRYARWLLHVEKEEDCRQVYMRASCVFVPISKPTVRLHWARFEEKLERKELAKDIHKAILHEIPGHIETIISLAGLLRRQFTFDEAIAELQKHVEESGPDVGGVLAAEQARLFWQVKKSIDEARQVFQNNTKRFSTSKHFWRKYLDFEACQPASEPSEVHERVKAVHELVIYDTYLSADARKELTLHYMEYVLILGGSEATEEYLLLDKAINGYVAPKNASPLPDEKPDDTEQDVAAVAEPSPTAMEM